MSCRSNMSLYILLTTQLASPMCLFPPSTPSLLVCKLMQLCDHWFQHHASSGFIGHIASPRVSLLQATKIRVAN